MSQAITPAVKTCAQCGEAKNLSEFSRDRTKPDGLQRQCKACDSEKMAAWRARKLAEDPDGLRRQQRENMRRMRARNPEVAVRERRQAQAQSLALTRLRELHEDEYRHLLTLAKREVGL